MSYVLWFVIYCILLRAFVGQYTKCVMQYTSMQGNLYPKSFFLSNILICSYNSSPVWHMSFSLPVFLSFFQMWYFMQNKHRTCYNVSKYRNVMLIAWHSSPEPKLLFPFCRISGDRRKVYLCTSDYTTCLLSPIYDDNLLYALYASRKLIMSCDRGAKISRNLRATSKLLYVHQVP
jgi:hypothetical protein